MHTIRSTHDGARIYQPALLALYDFLIMRVLSPHVWRCSPGLFVALYHDHMAMNHADIGVGTGYVLDRCDYQPGQVRLALFDLQPNCLRHTARRLARFTPATYQCDATKPITAPAGQFDSIALGGLLHCIPGTLQDKGKVFDAISPLMHSGTTVFGYTILNQGIAKTRLSRTVFYLLQKLKVINGIDDSAVHLEQALQQRFNRSEVRVEGCVALFIAQSPLHAQ